MVGVDFEHSDEVQEVAEKLIDKYHPHLKDTKDIIGYYVSYGSSEWTGKTKKYTTSERHVTYKQVFVFMNHDV